MDVDGESTSAVATEARLIPVLSGRICSTFDSPSSLSYSNPDNLIEVGRKLQILRNPLVVEIVDRYDSECVPDLFKSNKVMYIKDMSIHKNCSRHLKRHLTFFCMLFFDTFMYLLTCVGFMMKVCSETFVIIIADIFAQHAL
ncbi:hypothetical protein RJ639_028636 [Escallonia herrerae]|uniref:Uncharacterized protein n=1 Tax=Escallonia herrerae TaxID=1293975 RepID=A0AA88X752_9ASTE|nr:hypothetical protein RJ639_028636 [Escallonia herrerae]